MITALDRALSYWEDNCFLFENLERITRACGQPPDYPLNGSLTNWYRLRPALLKATSGVPFDETIMAADQESWKKHMALLGTTSSLPITLHCWNASSRRVYCLDADLQTLLEHTTLKGVRWGDVRFPFESFAILLDTPLIGPAGDAYQLLTVTISRFVPKNRTDIEIRLFPSSLEEYMPIPAYVKRRVREYITHRQYEKALKQLRQHPLLEKRHRTSLFYLFYDNVEHEFVSDDVVPMINRQFPGTAVNGPRPHWNAAARLAVGLCLYLESLGTKGRVIHTTPWNPVLRSGEPDPNAITSDAYVCAVSSIHALSNEERQIIGDIRAGREMSAHFRMAHWRHAPGTAHDPNALCTVWVQWAFVRPDRIRPGELPGGTLVNLRPR